jgi:acetyl-CoA carboxylase biotin carboxyl carrier protein
MTPQEIKDFLKLIRNTDIEEMRYRSGENSLYFKKSEVEPATLPSEKKNITNKDKKKEDKKLPLVAIKSTAVGTFISFRESDKAPFVVEGDNIVVGQKIGQLEAMKIIKDINSNCEGKILKVLVSNGQPVGYGQELFLVDVNKQ